MPGYQSNCMQRIFGWAIRPQAAVDRSPDAYGLSSIAVAKIAWCDSSWEKPQTPTTRFRQGQSKEIGACSVDGREGVCSSVTFQISYPVPLPSVPVYRDCRGVKAEHSETRVESDGARGQGPTVALIRPTDQSADCAAQAEYLSGPRRCADPRLR